MKIVIAGAGSAGKNLAHLIHALGHDVIVIDADAGALTEIGAELDVMTVVGQASSPETLESAKVSRCDVFVAVTSSDDVNLLACHLARSAEARHTIARINDIGYLHSTLLNLGKLGVDRALAHNERCAREIFDGLRLPGSFETTDLFKGRITAVGFRLPPESPLPGKPLAEFRDEKWFRKVRFIGVVREGALVIPRGDSSCLAGDDLYAVLPSNDADDFLDWALGGERPKIRKVIVAGGSRLGFSLAKLVERASMDCFLVEPDRHLADAASERLEKTQVIHADPVHASTIRELGLGPDTAFAALMEDQETNIMSCLQAKNLGAGYTVSRIDRPDFVPIVDKLGLLDRVASPYLSLNRAILSYIRGETVTDVGLFTHISGELQEVVLGHGNSWAGKTLEEVRLPEAAVVAAIQRGGDTFVPTGSFVLKGGDRLAVYSLQATAHRIRSVFA